MGAIRFRLSPDGEFVNNDRAMAAPPWTSLRELEAKSYKEIAGILDLTEEQVKVYLFRARQKLKQRFTEIENYGL